MHTTTVEYTNDAYDMYSEGTVEQFTCHHNGDFSGDIKIQLPTDRVKMVSAPAWPEDGYEIEIPFEVIKDIVAEYLRRELVGKFEDMPTSDLLQRFLL